MPRQTSLHRRGAVYYARIHIPTDLVPAMDGKIGLWRSLRTKDYGEAKRRLSAELDQWHATFDEMRRRRHLTEDDIAGAVWEHYTSGLESGDQERLTRPTSQDLDTAADKAITAAQRADTPAAAINAHTDYEILANKADWAAQRRTARLARLRADLASGDTRLIEPAADAFLERNRFQVDRGGPRYRDLCHKLMRADIEQLERLAERDRGDFTGAPRDPIVKEPEHLPEQPSQGGETIMALFGKYERENPNGIRPESFRQIRRDVGHFAAFVGPRVKASKIDKKMVREWKDLLGEYPVKASETKAFGGLGLREIVAANKKLASPKPTLSRQTVRRYMSSLGGFCRWLAQHDYLLANPVNDMLPKKSAPTTPRKSFSEEALGRLFRSPLFTTCKSEQWRDLAKAGNVAVRDHRYWIPYVMAYSGARPGEIAQLYVSDVRQEHGMWVMHVTEEGGGNRRTKTRSSMRLVPLHSELIKTGFVEHCEASKRAGHQQVFPEVEIPETGQIAAQFSREFNRYLTKVGVKTGPEIVTYSLRHTFIDQARRAGILDEEIGMVVGHDKATMTGRYGNEQEGTLRRRAEIVEAVTYPLRYGL